jgi:protoheme IX farnesyltransferase
MDEVQTRDAPRTAGAARSGGGSRADGRSRGQDPDGGAPPRSRGTARAYYELTKPGIAGYVMITAAVSAFVASRGEIGLALALHTMLGTGLATAGALALNQWVERGVDARMRRTRGRPLPSGRLRAGQARTFGLLLFGGGVLYLAVLAGWLPALLAALSAASYHWVYTPLKSRSYFATLAGGVPGALPTLIGWTAATGGVDLGGFALFSIAYLWQLPHVLGLAWMLREDYARVGFKLIPPHDDAGRVIGLHMVMASSALVPVSLVPSVLGYTGAVYFAGAFLASLAFLYVSGRAARRLTDASARRVFLASLLYHPVILGLMLLDTVPL